MEKLFNLKKSIFSTILILLIFHSVPINAATLNVPNDYPTIQEAVLAAKNEDVVLLADGIYKGKGNKNLDFKGKPLTLRSENGPEKTIIDCEGEGRGFIFQNKEDSRSVVSGISIINGHTNIGGAIYSTNATPRIKNCILSNCSASVGGALLVRSVILENCRIFNNMATRGGAIFFESTYGVNRNSSITDCEFDLNTAEETGGAIYITDKGHRPISRCTFYRNSAKDGGGGIYTYNGNIDASRSHFTENSASGYAGAIALGHSDSSINNCIFSRNTASVGGAITGFRAMNVIANCIFYKNSARNSGGAMRTFIDYSFHIPKLVNNIFWENMPDQIKVDGKYAPDLTYCNVQGGYPGEGNIQGDPLFHDPENGDFRLKDNSPCIFSGSASEAPSVDITGTPRPQGSGYDIGAYEAVGVSSSRPIIESFSADVTSGMIPFEVNFECSAYDPDGGSINYRIDYGDGSDQETNSTGVFNHRYESIGIGDAVCQAISDSGTVTNTYSISISRNGNVWVPLDFPTIQSAIDSVYSGNTIIVKDGVYRGEGNKNINFKGKRLILKSENGPENTIIDCENDGRGFIFENREDNQTGIEGFTVKNGNGIAPTVNTFGSGRGGAIYCDGSSPRIQNCILKNNSGVNGGGIYCHNNAAPQIIKSIFDGNTAQQGGGLYHRQNSSPLIDSCFFKNNKAWSGGAIYLCYSANPTISNSIFTTNRATNGGAVYYSTAPTIINSVFYQNMADHRGGGICTEYRSAGTVKNSIFWENLPNEIFVNRYDECLVSFSDVYGEYPGEGNFHGNPLFVNPENDNFKIDPASPCLDAGTKENAPAADINGELRPKGNGLEIGAYEIDFPANSRPIIDSFTADVVKGIFPLTVKFTCTARDPNGKIVLYEIDYGDGSSTEQSVDGKFTHVYTKSGFYYATCVPVDNNGIQTNSKSIKLTIGIVFVPEDYETIQSAIDSAKTNSQIIINQGTYNESLRIDKSISLKSLLGRQYTKLHAARTEDHAIFVNAPNTGIEGFSIYGATEKGNAGIFLSGAAKNCTIKNNRLGWDPKRKNHIGINLASGSDNNNIINNSTAYNDVGLLLEYSYKNKISENICSHNEYGMVIWQSNENCFESNNMNQNTYGALMMSASQNLILKNESILNSRGFILKYSKENLLRENKLNQNLETGIQVLASSENKILSNQFSSSPYGIVEQFSCNNVFATNEFNSISNSNHYSVEAIKGDVDADGAIGLTDAILSLQILSGLPQSGMNMCSEVDGDGVISTPETIYILQKIGDIRVKPY